MAGWQPKQPVYSGVPVGPREHPEGWFVHCGQVLRVPRDCEIGETLEPLGRTVGEIRDRSSCQEVCRAEGCHERQSYEDHGGYGPSELGGVGGPTLSSAPPDQDGYDATQERQDEGHQQVRDADRVRRDIVDGVKVVRRRPQAGHQEQDQLGREQVLDERSSPILSGPNRTLILLIRTPKTSRRPTLIEFNHPGAAPRRRGGRRFPRLVDPEGRGEWPDW